MTSLEQQINLQEIIALLSSTAIPRCTEDSKALLADLNPGEIAHVLEGLPSEVRAQVFHCIPPDFEGEVLLQMGEVAASELAELLDIQKLRDVAEEMDSSDVAELLEVLSDESVEDLLESMSAQRRARIEANLAYEEDSAGRLMQSDSVSIRPDVSVETVLRYIRLLDDIPPDTVALMVVDREGYFKGTITVLNLLRVDPDALIETVMDDNFRALKPTDSEHEVAIVFETHDLIAAPVINNDGFFLGRVVIDDVVDLIREQGDHAFFGQAGLDDEEDLFGPLVPSAKRRAFWLAVNLATAFATAWVIGLFEATLDKVVALAILMPIVASMGGIAATQTLTLTIRGIALKQIGRNNTSKLLNKEIGISLINGGVWAIVVGVVAWLWFGDAQIGGIISVALAVNMLFGAIAGILVPLFLDQIKLDPALSGAVVVTTVTDILGFILFLGLATVFLL